MWTVVASYAPVSRSPVTRASSSTRRVSHTQSWRPPPPPFFPASAAVKCSRPTIPVARSVCPPEKHRPVFNIPPTALLYHVPPPEGKERWEIKDDEDNVQLWLQVPGLTEDDLEITTTDDLLEIKRKGGDPRRLEDVHGVGSFHLRLLLTKEFVSSQVRAELKAGMLEVTIPKNTNLRRTVVRIGQQPQAPAAGRSVPPNDRPRDSGVLPKDPPPPANSPPKNNLVRGTTMQPKDSPARELPKKDLGGGISVPPKDPPANGPPKNNLAGDISVPPKDPPRNTNEPPKNPPGIREANLGRPN